MFFFVFGATCHRGCSPSNANYSLLDAKTVRTFSWFRNSTTTTPAPTAGPSSSQMSPPSRPRGSNRGWQRYPQCNRLTCSSLFSEQPACCRGRKSPTGKENSESILALSLAGDIARCRLKRRQRYRWAGLLSFEKPMEQDADSVPRGGRQHSNHANREWLARSCVV